MKKDKGVFPNPYVNTLDILIWFQELDKAKTNLRKCLSGQHGIKPHEYMNYGKHLADVLRFDSMLTAASLMLEIPRNQLRVAINKYHEEIGFTKSYD